jgi:hypothetical protein
MVNPEGQGQLNLPPLSFGLERRLHHNLDLPVVKAVTDFVMRGAASEIRSRSPLVSFKPL